MTRYKHITFACFNVDQLIGAYKIKYQKDYQLIGYKLEGGKATITLYPRNKETKENV